MIEPISTTAAPSTPIQIQGAGKAKAFNPSMNSTLSSMHCPKGVGTVMGYVREFLSFIGNFFKWLFCCGCCGKAPSAKMEAPSKLPEGLLSDDPFAKITLTSEGKFRNQEGFKKTQELFSVLGTTSFAWWIFNKNSLAEMGEKLQAINFHPLEFIYMLLWNQQSTIWTVNYKAQAIAGEYRLSWIGRYPWQEFLRKQARNFNKRSDEIPGALPGFCKALKLDFEIAQDFATKEDWEGLILYILSERQKAYKIS